MCGILGLYTEDINSHIQIISNLMKELEIRGKHSFGISFYKDKKYHVYKSFNNDTEMFLEKLIESDIKKFIFHNRYSTSGDFENMNNNQPIVDQNKGSIVLNGIFSMKTKEEYEKEFNIKCETENDTEIYLRLEDPNKFLLENKTISFALAYLNQDKIFCIRNNKRPLYFYEDIINDNLIKFVTSTSDTIVRSGGKLENIRKLNSYEEIYI